MTQGCWEDHFIHCHLGQTVILPLWFRLPAFTCKKDPTNVGRIWQCACAESCACALVQSGSGILYRLGIRSELLYNYLG